MDTLMIAFGRGLKILCYGILFLVLLGVEHLSKVLEKFFKILSEISDKWGNDVVNHIKNVYNAPRPGTGTTP